MKNKNKKKTSMKMGIIVAILLLAVGFAAVSTVLVINGTIKIKPDTENFEKKVIFSSAEASKEGGSEEVGNDPTASIDQETQKKITFTTQTMKDIGEKSILKYKIKNNSQYAANITGIECTRAEAPSDDHIKITEESISEVIQPGKESGEHTVTVEMIKSYVGEDESATKTITFTCTIQADAQEATPTD